VAGLKPPPLPAILTANALRDGIVVYRGEAGWSARLEDALVARDPASLGRLEGARDALETGGEVVDPALIAVAIDSAGRVVPGHYRERIRARGPTIRADLGPQAAGEHIHVSL
jgi:sulfite reductase (NADPH) hemoprotein beta-component